jgi:TonB dependent receptor
MQPYLNAFPIPNGPEDPANPGAAQFNASFSNPATLDAYSLRIDHRLNSKLTIFGRYNYSPSEISQRGPALSSLTSSRIAVETATIGATLASSPFVTNDLRFNYSRTESTARSSLDGFGGAVPLTALPFPSSYNAGNANLGFFILQALKSGGISVGKLSKNLQRQYNIVDSVTVQRGSHSLKFGVDYRHLSPVSSPFSYEQEPLFFSLAAAENGNPDIAQVVSQNSFHFIFQNLGVFAQDTWRIVPRITLTYGLRWDVDFAPSSNPFNIPAVTGFNLNDLSQLALAPAGTPAFRTPYGNVAPRVGVAYQLSQSQNWGSVLRGGFGFFYDLADGEVNSFLASSTSYPYGAIRSCFSVVQRPGCPATLTFPLDAATAAPPSIAPGSGTLTAFDPNLSLPYTLEWNAALEQGLGKQQTLSVSYIGASGRRLIQPGLITQPNPNVAKAYLVSNLGTSGYNALQLQFQRRLLGGLQALGSYTWSHSIDTGSVNSLFASGANGNGFVPGLSANVNRGPSDFDIRNAFSAGVTYDIPVPKINAFANAIFRGWSLQNIVEARSASPVDISNSSINAVLNGQANVRPDVTPGIPLYLFGRQYPGGKAFNNTPGVVPGGCSDGSQSIGPFCPPPIDPNTGNPLRQGNLGRNALRGFGATQWDLAVHRDFPIHETLKLQFRAEIFNVLNHPNFGPPVGDLSSASFGQSINMLGQSLASGSSTGSGGFNPLYQIGGPRSIQLALKLMF